MVVNYVYINHTNYNEDYSIGLFTTLVYKLIYNFFFYQKLIYKLNPFIQRFEGIKKDRIRNDIKYVNKLGHHTKLNNEKKAN